VASPALVQARTYSALEVCRLLRLSYRMQHYWAQRLGLTRGSGFHTRWPEEDVEWLRRLRILEALRDEHLAQRGLR